MRHHHTHADAPGRVRPSFPVLLAALSLAGSLACSPGRREPPRPEGRPPPGGDSRAAAGSAPRDGDLADARRQERLRMVREQIAEPTDGRPPVTDLRVLRALREVPRHRFVPPVRRWAAYHDTPLPIGHDQTISQPYIVALMTELLAVEPGEKVFEVGTGSGYQAAVLAALGAEVWSVEILEPLAEEARERLATLGYERVRTRSGDGYLGWPEAAPFDAVIVTCGAEHVPPPLWEQLAPGGRMVIPVGGAHQVQELRVLTRLEDGSRRERTVMPVRFVPLTRREASGDGQAEGDP